MRRAVREVREVPGPGSTSYARRLCVNSKDKNALRELLPNDGPGTSRTSGTDGPISRSFASSKGLESPSYVCEKPFEGRAGSSPGLAPGRALRGFSRAESATLAERPPRTISVATGLFQPAPPLRRRRNDELLIRRSGFVTYGTEHT